ncbi:LacI family DNA-binding transcriptional regulator [Microbispora bryophytorum]|uniref:LacI family DNA-binding transcriptional regulator n=1 Tax=Microbispora bryophytorum TaxID=1460882 RepID=UPI0033D1E9ED
MKRASLKEVARLADVSVPTASRVLSGVDRNVDAALAERVREAADTLGYRVNAAARALRRQSTDTLALLVPGIANPYFAELVAAFSQRLAAEGRSLITVDTNDDIEIEAVQLRSIDRVLVDALMVVPVSRERSGEAIRKVMRTRRVVQVDRTAADVDAISVGLDNATGVAVLVDHLRSIGRDRIVFVDARSTSSAGRERLNSFLGLAGPSDWVIDMPTFSVRSGVEAARRLLDDPRAADAVICAADVLAVGMLTTLQQAGVRVPDDIALTGFDGTSLAEIVEPGLTTLASHTDAIVDASLAAVAGADVDVVIAPSLDVRGSTVRKALPVHEKGAAAG